MPAWITSLLRELAPVPKRPAASRIRTSRPRSASSRAAAWRCHGARAARAGSYNARIRAVARPEEQVPAVSYRLEGEVAVLTIANPPVNALSLPVREGLLQGLQRAEQDRAVRSVGVTGAGGTFAAGADT